jgi:hypothetical protein
MVGLDLLPNAVSLNSVVMNSARVIGPAIGGVLILTLGVSVCFIVNAASYAAVIVALSLMRRADLYSKPGVVRAKGQVREGLRYVWATGDLRSPLLSMAIVGVFAFNFTVTLPLLAKVTFHGGAGLYSTFLAAMGAGAVIGGLFTAHRSNPSTRLLAVIGVLFGTLITAVSLAPTKLVAIILLVPMGAASISFIATNNATLQLRADPAMRGRVMSLNAVAFLGSTPIGATLLGYISDVTNPRVALVVGGVATLMASVPLFFLAIRQREAPAVSPAPLAPVDCQRGTRCRRPVGPSTTSTPGRACPGRAMAEEWALYRDRRRAGSFGDDAERYDRVRPQYPAELIDSLLAPGRTRCSTWGAAPGSRPGCSPERGCDVLGLEPDPRMAAVARRRGVSVVEGTIEEWDPGDRRFDLLTAGQAWHWVDPQRGPVSGRRGPTRAAASASSGTRPDPTPPCARPSRRRTPAMRRHSAGVRAHGSTGRVVVRVHRRVLPENRRVRRRGIEVFGHDVDYSSEEWVELAGTHSDHHTLPPAQLADLLADLRRQIDQAGGRVPVHYETTLVSGRRR